MTEIKAVVGKTDEKRDALIRMLFERIKKEYEKDGVFEVGEQKGFADEYIEPIFQQDMDTYSKKANNFWSMLDETEYNAFRLGVYAAGLILGEVTQAERSGR